MIAMKLPFFHPFDITGKPMKGWMMVEKEGFKTDNDLKAWWVKAKESVTTLHSKG
jgi:hypothetical protein